MSEHTLHDSHPRPVEEMVAGARRGESTAWHAIIERYRPLIHAVARGYRLNECDAEDVGQTVWLRLVEHLDRLREPRALARWLVCTANHESLRLTRSNRRFLLVDPLNDPAQHLETGHPGEPDAELLRLEQAQALRRGLATLPPAQRDLLALLADDRPLSYREISEILDIPMGSIGPTRGRGLARLRATPAVRDFLDVRDPGWARRNSA
jgi:RNA polymerase sigma factor (sigma-70 family)